jgi:hypothetical protein
MNGYRSKWNANGRMATPCRLSLLSYYNLRILASARPKKIDPNCTFLFYVISLLMTEKRKSFLFLHPSHMDNNNNNSDNDTTSFSKLIDWGRLFATRVDRLGKSITFGRSTAVSFTSLFRMCAHARFLDRDCHCSYCVLTRSWILSKTSLVSTEHGGQILLDRSIQ